MIMEIIYQLYMNAYSSVKKRYLSTGSVEKQKHLVWFHSLVYLLFAQIVPQINPNFAIVVRYFIKAKYLNC